MIEEKEDIMNGTQEKGKLIQERKRKGYERRLIQNQIDENKKEKREDWLVFNSSDLTSSSEILPSEAGHLRFAASLHSWARWSTAINIIVRCSSA